MHYYDKTWISSFIFEIELSECWFELWYLVRVIITRCDKKCIFIDAVPCLNFIYNLLAYSRGVSPDSPCRGSVLSSTIPNMSKTNEERRNEIAATTSSKALATAAAATATTTSVLQRPRTGGLDQDSSQSPSPSKSRLNFLEGFRSTLRPRSPVRNNSIPVSNNIEIIIIS